LGEFGLTDFAIAGSQSLRHGIIPTPVLRQMFPPLNAISFNEAWRSFLIIGETND
jgi:hypothetical protein